MIMTFFFLMQETQKQTMKLKEKNLEVMRMKKQGAGNE